MAKRTKVSDKVKELLINEAGNKCANPGCSSIRTHIHHIKEWAVYKTHDEKHMIAVCPNCHDAIHYGKLKISDETVYKWKNLERQHSLIKTYIYIEPSAPVKILTGTISLLCKDEKVNLFFFSKENRFEFQALNHEIMLLNLSISTLKGEKLIEIVDNHIKHQLDKKINYNQTPGHVNLTSPGSSGYLPKWAIEIMRVGETNYASGETVTILDIEVLRPGLLRLQGAWVQENKAIIITKNSFSFISPNFRRPISLAGEGEDSILEFEGFTDLSVFGDRFKIFD